MFRSLLEPLDPRLAFRVYDVGKSAYPFPWISALMDLIRELHRRRKRLTGITGPGRR